MPISAYFRLFPPILRLFSAYFHLFFAYFPPVVPHPYYKLKHVTHLLFFRPHVYGCYLLCLFSAHFPPIFRLKFCLFSAGPVLPGTSKFAVSIVA